MASYQFRVNWMKAKWCRVLRSKALCHGTIHWLSTSWSACNLNISCIITHTFILWQIYAQTKTDEPTKLYDQLPAILCNGVTRKILVGASSSTSFAFHFMNVWSLLHWPKNRALIWLSAHWRDQYKQLQKLVLLLPQAYKAMQIEFVISESSREKKNCHLHTNIYIWI